MKAKFHRYYFSWRQNFVPLVLGFIWLLLIAGLLYISYTRGLDTNLCWFKHVIGMNCPTCGTTRVLFSLANLQVLQAFLINPLVFIFSILFTIYLILRIFFHRDFRLKMNREESTQFWIILIVIFILNWIYVIHTLK